jgi:hypothetical protein
MGIRSVPADCEAPEGLNGRIDGWAPGASSLAGWLAVPDDLLHGPRVRPVVSRPDEPDPIADAIRLLHQAGWSIGDVGSRDGLARKNRNPVFFDFLGGKTWDILLPRVGYSHRSGQHMDDHHEVLSPDVSSSAVGFCFGPRRGDRIDFGLILPSSAKAGGLESPDWPWLRCGQRGRSSQARTLDAPSRWPSGDRGDISTGGQRRARGDEAAGRRIKRGRARAMRSPRRLRGERPGAR